MVVEAAFSFKQTVRCSEVCMNVKADRTRQPPIFANVDRIVVNKSRSQADHVTLSTICNDVSRGTM